MGIPPDSDARKEDASSLGSHDVGSGLLPHQSGPGALGICTTCGRWFAMTFRRTVPHGPINRLTEYQCVRCGSKEQYFQFPIYDSSKEGDYTGPETHNEEW